MTECGDFKLQFLSVTVHLFSEHLGAALSSWPLVFCVVCLCRTSHFVDADDFDDDHAVCIIPRVFHFWICSAVGAVQRSECVGGDLLGDID